MMPIFVLIFLFCRLGLGPTAPTITTPQKICTTAFKSSTKRIPQNLQKQIKKYTWHKGCPTSFDDLRYIQLSFCGFDKKTHQGELIINKSLAKEVVAIFKTIYQAKYPIERMHLMDMYQGDDLRAMEDNNTSAFNCREVTGKPGTFSQHSYGRAIDINPRINPFVKGAIILPSNGVLYADRSVVYPGTILKDALIYRVFSEKVWDWGGGWFDLQDYQHFEKRANGKKRNPYG